MIYLQLQRVGVCEVCSEQFTIPQGEHPPERCLICGSFDWLWGREPSESVYIRQRIAHLDKAINPGAKARNRQERGKAQFRRFKPKEVDDAETPKDN